MKHVTSRRTYLLVYVGLLVLLAATVAVALVDLGPWGIGLALAIALAKAVLIALFFMHVRGANHLVQLASVGAFVWLGIMFVLTFNDYLSRSWIPLPGI
ncbi:MAG: caa(3)-type oxidase subunit IV [Oscillochloris sp.]|nr:caa(3)-type oxidase subunit IV [Oscillochloris sp.]